MGLLILPVIELDVPARLSEVDANGVRWFKLSPEHAWGSDRTWRNALRRHQRKGKRT